MYIRDCSNTVVPSLHVWFALYSEFMLTFEDKLIEDILKDLYSALETI